MKFLQAIAFFFAISHASARLGSASDNENHPHDPRFLRASDETNVVRGSYIIMFDDSAPNPKQLIAGLLKANPDAELGHEYTTLFHGYSVKNLPEQSMHDFLAENPGVTMTVEEDRNVHKSAVTWGLDRIDERDLPLDNQYVPPNGIDGSGVDIYILDTGVRTSHDEFTGRIKQGINYPNDGFDETDDPDGHGTHVASSAAGTVYGVAKKASIISVRVLDKDGNGSSSDTIKGLDWVASQHGAGKKSVANLSLGGDFVASENRAVKRAVELGVVVVVAAGNENQNACNTSPASAAEAITVGSTDSNDRRASDSNWGNCLDIFGPGENILAASSASNSATVTYSGTSMASPHVAGAAALLLQADGSKTGAAASVALVEMASSGKVINPRTGSPNKLLYVGEISGSSPNPAPAPAPTPSSGASVEVSVSFDNYPEETTFGIQKNEGGSWSTVFSHSGTQNSPATYTTTQTLQDGSYRFFIRDSVGDGICCSEDYGNGSYTLTDKSNNNNVFATGGEFGSVEYKPFTVSNGLVSTGSAPAPAPAPSPSPSTITFQMTVVYDEYPEETTFSLEKQSGSSWTTVHSESAPGANSDPDPVTVTKSLSNGTYRFVIRDISQYEDGICCEYGNGSFTLKVNGSQLATGGEFGSQAVVTFDVANGSASVVSSTP